MSPHPQHARMYQPVKRQEPAPSISLDGFSGASTQGNTSPSTSATNLAIDPTARPTSNVAPPILTSSTTVASSSTPSETATASPAATSSSKDIPIGTVVGACVGAFLGAALLIAIGFYFYRRSAPPARDTRSFSKLDPDTKDGEEKADGSKYPPGNKSKTDLPYALPATLPKSPMDEKLNMFQTKSLKSVHSSASDYSQEHTGYSADGHAAVMTGFSSYTPALAEQLANGTGAGAINSQSTPNLHKDTRARPFQGRLDNQSPVVSWDGETVGNFSVRSSSQYDLRASSQIIDTEFKSTGAMSPSLVLAIPTPAATSTVHRWEVAQVENFEQPLSQGNAAVIKTGSTNPFAPQKQAEDPDRTPRPSLEHNPSSAGRNPFFNAKDDGFNSRKRSISGKSEISVAATETEDAYVERAKENAKGKQRARATSVSTLNSIRSNSTVHAEPGSNNPFAPPVPASPRPLPPVFQAQHNATLSDSDKAIQSLIAALDIQPTQRDSLSSEYTDASEGVNAPWVLDSPNGLRG